MMSIKDRFSQKRNIGSLDISEDNSEYLRIDGRSSYSFILFKGAASQLYHIAPLYPEIVIRMALSKNSHG